MVDMYMRVPVHLYGPMARGYRGIAMLYEPQIGFRLLCQIWGRVLSVGGVGYRFVYRIQPMVTTGMSNDMSPLVASWSPTNYSAHLVTLSCSCL